MVRALAGAAGVLLAGTGLAVAPAAAAQQPGDTAPAERPAINLYVAPDGSDGNAGRSAQQPLASLQGAQSAARRATRSGLPVHVWIKGGSYHLGRTLQFDDRDSGRPGAPVTYSAYPGEKVVLSGGRQLHPHWSTYQGGIQVADVGSGLSLDGLFVDGQRQTLARYPNYDPGTAVLGGSTTMQDLAAEAKAKGWTDVTAGDVRALHCNTWGGASFHITGMAADGSLGMKWVGDNNRNLACANPQLPYDAHHVVAEGILQELDAPGEWYYASGTGKLYYYPPAGTDVTRATVETAELDELVHLAGTSAEAPVHDLSFSGITFTQTHRTLFDHPYEGTQLGDWAVARTGAVYLKNAQRVTVTGATFDQVGGNGVFMDGYNDHNTVSDSTFRDSGATDVQVVGSESAVRDPSTWQHMVTALDDTAPGPKTQDYPRDITISGNSMSGMGVFEKQSAGVNISMSRRVTVSHNTIHDSPRSCVNIDDGTWGGHVVEFNDMFDCVKETGDHGPFNSWGRDRFWPLSDDATQRAYAKLDVVEPNIIRNNRIWHSSEWAIDLDDGSGNYQITGNLLLNAGIKLRDGFFRTVENNVIVGGSIYEQVSHADNGDVIRHNIVLSPQPYQNVLSDPAVARYVADDNLFWNNGGKVTLPGNWAGNGLDAHSAVSDPQFTAGSPWQHPSMTDFTVSGTSPALALGFTNVPMDRFGDGRPGEATPPAVTWPAPPVSVTVDSQPEPLMGATASAVYSDAVMSSVGLSDHDGLYLAAVPAGSYAAAQGFQAADVIRAVNGTAVTTRDSFWRLYNVLPPGSTVTAAVWRHQAATTVSFTKPTGDQTYNDTAGVEYTGPGWDWKGPDRGGANSYQNDLYATTNHGDAFSYTFNGTGVDLVSETNSDEGTVDIYVDGTLLKTVDCATGTRQYQQTVYSLTGLAPGTHIVKGVMTGGSYMIVDAFTVHG
ncbi:right-handed parallel beta-helix repeat-containing protein [Streptomyces sp. NPDC020917]|uniref:right-handed parallel beta-helix repeat-containing protein n=1 Tax=Streptomyces sp. NPDC020917 TaxID=3365102 RepID=UPI00379EBAEA